MSNIEDKMDRMVQQWACRQKSYLSYMPAQCGHHYKKRRIDLLRWDLRNIIPLTFNEHTLVHSGALHVEIQNPFRLLYLEQRATINLKSYLLENGWTRDEWLKIQYTKLERELDE